MATFIPLRSKARGVIDYAVVSDNKASLVEPYKWWLSDYGYAMTTIPHPDGGHSNSGDPRKRRLFMHRLILGLDFGDQRQCDHKSGDKLDNRNQNLRIVTNAQNMENKAPYRNSTSPYRGVSWLKHANKWQASVQINKVGHYLGLFDDELEAAKVAADFRREHMPYSYADQLPIIAEVAAA